MMFCEACGGECRDGHPPIELHEFLARERAALAEFERRWEKQWSRDVWAASARGEPRPTSTATVAEWRARYQRYLRGL